MDKDSLSHTSWDCACHVVWIPKRRRKAPCGETEREVGEMPGMLAGAGMVGGAPAPTTRASAPGCAQARRGQRGGQIEEHGRDHAARAAP